MDDNDWLGCSLIEVDPEHVSSAPVFKNTRLPVETITGNVDGYMDAGLPLDRAIAETPRVSRAHLEGRMVSGPFSIIVPRTNASFSLDDPPRRRRI